MRTTWTNCGPEHGLWCRVVSDKGHCIRVAMPADAVELELILNQLEQAAAFGDCDCVFCQELALDNLCDGDYEP